VEFLFENTLSLEVKKLCSLERAEKSLCRRNILTCRNMTLTEIRRKFLGWFRMKNSQVIYFLSACNFAILGSKRISEETSILLLIANNLFQYYESS